MSGLFGGGDKTQQTQTTQGTTYPAWITGAQQGATTAAGAMANPFLQVPNYGIAGFNPDQLKAFDLTRGMAQNAFTGAPVRSVGAAPTLATTTNASTTNATAAQVDPASIMAGVNPFLQTVGNATLDNSRREYGNTIAGIGAKYGSGQAFGGSGEAIATGQAARGYAADTASTIASLMAQGYDQASALAQANAQMRQQAELTNAGAANNTSQFNAGANNSNSQFNANLGTDFTLRAPTIEDGLANNAQTRQLNALQQLLGTGATQQGLAQNALDIPWTTLARYAALVPQVFDSNTTGTTTAPDNSPSGLQQLLGLGLTIGGMGTTGGGSVLGNYLFPKT